MELKIKLKVLDNLIDSLTECNEIPIDFKLVHIAVFESIKLDLIKLSKIYQEEKKDD